MDYSKNYVITPYISEEEINQKIIEMAGQLTEHFKGQKVTLICILKGSFYFATELAQHIPLPMNIDFMQVSSYGDGTTAGKLFYKKDLDQSIEGENVILVEDIIDTGNTLSALKKELEKRNPKELLLVTLLNKPARRKVSIDPDMYGFEIEDKFVVGCGLDYGQRYRNLPYIGVVENPDS